MPSRTWLVTGVSSGFGRELTAQLLDRSDTVVGTVRDPAKTSDLAGNHPDAFHVEVLDVTDTAAVRALVDCAYRLGRVDVVVSNAGYGLFGAAEELALLDNPAETLTRAWSPLKAPVLRTLKSPARAC